MLMCSGNTDFQSCPLPLPHSSLVVNIPSKLLDARLLQASCTFRMSLKSALRKLLSAKRHGEKIRAVHYLLAILVGRHHSKVSNLGTTTKTFSSLVLASSYIQLSKPRWLDIFTSKAAMTWPVTLLVPRSTPLHLLKLSINIALGPLASSSNSKTVIPNQHTQPQPSKAIQDQPQHHSRPKQQRQKNRQ